MRPFQRAAMGSKKLTEFLQQKKRKKDVDWDKVRTGWLESLERLGSTLKTWLREPIDKKLLTVDRIDDVTLIEDDLGTYQAPSWVIRTDRERILVTPVARMIVGGQGRVDLIHGPRKVMLIQTKPDVWKLRRTETVGSLCDADEQSFSDAIQQLLE